MSLRNLITILAFLGAARTEAARLYTIINTSITTDFVFNGTVNCTFTQISNPNMIINVAGPVESDCPINQQFSLPGDTSYNCTLTVGEPTLASLGAISIASWTYITADCLGDITARSAITPTL